MTPFEDFLFYDAGREVGSESLADAVTILHFSGRPDFLRLERAISEAARHHPTAQNSVLVHSNGTLEWTCSQSEIQLVRPESLSLPLPPLALIGLGKPLERVFLVDAKPGDSLDYYRKNGVHFVPKLQVPDLLL